MDKSRLKPSTKMERSQIALMEFPTYYAWQQEVGSPNIVQDLEFKGQAGTEVRLSDTVLAGDVMSASVIDRGLETHWSITDTRDGKHVWSASSIWRTDYQHKHTAECIVEDPRTPKGQILPLADFGQVPFSACQAVDEGGNLVNMASAQLPTGWSFREYSLDKNTRVESMPSLNPLALDRVAPTWTSVGPISTATATQDDGDVSCPTVTFCLAALTWRQANGGVEREPMVSDLRGTTAARIDLLFLY